MESQRAAVSLIGITGGSGSGKTELIKQLRPLFTEDQVCVLSQDNYYRARSVQEIDDHGFENFDVPTALDLDTFRRDVIKLREGKAVVRPEYAYNDVQSEARELVVNPASIVVIEGLFVFADCVLRDLVDFKIYVHARDNLKVIRRVRRDRRERNYPVDAVLHRYEHHVMPAYDQFVAPYRENADIVINNNQNFDKGLEMLAGFFKSRLQAQR
ncbi:MAG: uridine kinase [Saprospiraceae bacterium]|nr:uridine kinase [Saprospiraceae bacterium]